MTRGAALPNPTIMAEQAALPTNMASTDGAVFTFIVPALDGCNLNCPYCFIDWRKEATTRLDSMPLSYATFIDEAIVRQEVGAVCVQGHEPLLPTAFEYTGAILETGERLGIPASLDSSVVEPWIQLLDRFPESVTVSLEIPTIVLLLAGFLAARFWTRR